MNETFVTKTDAAIYRRIRAIPMFESRRRAALEAMKDAFAFADVYDRVARSIQHAARLLSFKQPTLRH